MVLKQKKACMHYTLIFVLLSYCGSPSLISFEFFYFSTDKNMAGALVGGAFLSAFLQVLFDRMATPEVVDLFRGQKLTTSLLRKLEISLQAMNTVLEDAEEKQLTTPNVRTWLDGLKDAVYDAEDIVDDISTKALRLKIAASKVRNHISMSLFVNKIERKKDKRATRET